MNNVIITQIRNQEGRLFDWILYHSEQGFDTFIIFDDNSNDKSLEEIDEVSNICKSNIIVRKTDGLGNIYNDEDPNSYGGDKSLNDRINRSYTTGLDIVRKVNPNAVCLLTDVDEYLVSNLDDNLTDIIQNLLTEKNVNQLIINSFDVKDDFEFGKWYTSTEETKARWNHENIMKTTMGWRYKSLCRSHFVEVVNQTHVLNSSIEDIKENFRVYEFDTLRIHHLRKPNLNCEVDFIEDDTLIKKMNKIKKSFL